ncbi:MAG: chromosome segregation ATPase-like protein, partial [Paracoccaceae bacterium]
MLTDNTLIALGIAGAVVALTLILMALTLRYARAVAAAGRIEELAVYDRQLEEKRGLMRDLEEELEKQSTVADISAEVDGLRRQRDELLTEWESLRARREEVQAVRQDAETAMIERQALEAELIPMRAEYLAIKADLDQARDLTTRIATLNIEHQSLSDQVAALSAQA